MSARTVEAQRFELAVARRVRTRREELDLTQEMVADHMAQQGYGWIQTTVAKTELMQRPLWVNELPGLAESLRTTVAALLGFNEPTSSSPLVDAERRIRQSYADALSKAIGQVLGGTP